MSMLCLPVLAPWGSLMFLGGGLAKDVENRGWALPKGHKLPLEVLIYQGQKWDPNFTLAAMVEMLGLERIAAAVSAILGRDQVSLSTAELVAAFFTMERCLPRRAILGTVKITGCRQDSKSRWAAPGAWHWELAEAKRFDKPITYLAGRQAKPFFWAPSPNEQELFKPHDGKTRRVDVRVECPDVMITRNAGPWGNPYGVGQKALRWVTNPKTGTTIARQAAIPDLEVCSELFEKYARHHLKPKLSALKGLRLGCYCRADQPCHGDVLVKLVKEVCGA